MQEPLVDFITSLDGYGAAEGWPGSWGLQGPEYLAWLGEQPEHDYTVLMGASTYRLMSGFAAAAETLEADEAAGVGRGRDEARRRRPEAHARQPHLCRSLLEAGLVDRFRVVVFPVMTGSTGPRPDLRRLSRRRARHGCQPNVRRPAPAARVCPEGAYRSTRHTAGF